MNQSPAEARIRPPLMHLFFLLAGLLLAIFMLSGCSQGNPIRFSSVMDIGTDESGTRTITAEVDKDVLKSLFDTKRFSIKQFLESECPAELSWVCEDKGEYFNVIFTLSFDSLDEYQEKLCSLTGISDCVLISRPQLGAQGGFTLAETVDILPLFGWMAESMRQQSGLSASSISSYMTAVSNELVYAGRSFPQSDERLYCYVENIPDVECIDILTEYALADEWMRIILVTFPDPMPANAANVKTYLSSLLPDGVSERWPSDNVWRLTFPSGKLADINRLMAGLFQKPESKGFTQETGVRDVLQVVCSFEEPVNAALFAPGNETCRVRYYFKAPEGSVLTPLDDSGSDDSLPKVKTTYAGYTCLFDSSIREYTYRYRLSFRYQPRELLVHTTVRSIQELSRSIIFSLGEIPKEHRELLVDSLSRYASKYGAIDFLYTRDENQELEYRIRFSQDGTPLDLMAGFASVFGGRETLSYTPGSAALLANQGYTFSDSMDFTSMLYAPGRTVITSAYVFPSGASVTPAASDPDVQGVYADDASLVILSTNGMIDTGARLLSSSPVKPWLIFLFVCLGLLLLAILSLYLKASGIPAMIRRQAPPDTPASPDASDADGHDDSGSSSETRTDGTRTGSGTHAGSSRTGSGFSTGAGSGRTDTRFSTGAGSGRTGTRAGSSRTDSGSGTRSF